MPEDINTAAYLAASEWNKHHQFTRYEEASYRDGFAAGMTTERRGESLLPPSVAAPTPTENHGSLGLQTWTPAKGLINLTQRPVVGCITRRVEHLRCQEHALEIRVGGHIFIANLHTEDETLSAEETADLLTILAKSIKRKAAGETPVPAPPPFHGSEDLPTK